MEREGPSCQFPTHKSFRRRMEEKSEWLKQKRGTPKAAEKAPKERTTVETVGALDDLQQKWKTEQFHFDNREETIDQRDEEIGMRELAKDTYRSVGTSLQSRSMASRHRRRMRESNSNMTKASIDQYADAAISFHENELKSPAKGDPALSSIWKAKHLDAYLENMIQKLQKQSDTMKTGKQFDKQKQEKREKLLCLLLQIKEQMSKIRSSVVSPKRNERTTPLNVRCDPAVSAQCQSESFHPFETIGPFGQSTPVVEKKSKASDIDEYAVIPKEIIAEMQKLLNAHKHTDQARAVLGRNVVRRVPTTSILDAIPENESMVFDDMLDSAKEAAKHSFRKTKGRDERIRRERHAFLESIGTVDRAVDFFVCGKIC
ncbi:hypothetical protein FisN_2Lh598 [Fistulifera solaris]|uniref:Uncharacterized protein n=1 Tax=Fistulifera solaris TaxID=1519565 RepID=A0A1Z5JBD0_FISSO|nr:hypothetical protein FisN_2Lh598 [Fistulifera solaris]|eukprot:GAX11071.1 hypothetical protein FisN_2Lh598 [Fistulifera solaris]